MEESTKKVTVGQLWGFKEKLWQDDNLYSIYSFKNIAHLFLKEFLGDDILQKLTFEQIRLKYIDCFEGKGEAIDSQRKAIIADDEGKEIEIHLPPIPEIPEKEEDFFAYICKEQIGLKTEPRLCLLELYQQSSKDLREIEERISKYQEEIEKYNQHNVNTPDDDYRREILKHYINLNIDAKNEILKFITSENIKICGLEEAKVRGPLQHQLYLFQQEYCTYSYRYQRSRYDIDKLSEIANKFLDAPYPEMPKIENLYKNKPLEFYQYAQNYISNNQIIEKIKQYINENHFLNARIKILLPALEEYQRNNKVLFINLATLQIEGIFHDYCIGLGIPEESLRKASMGEKLDKIISINPNLYDFEYFKFIFPKTRNRVAHGKLFSNAEEANIISCLLILDLYDVCSRITSDDIPVNLLVNLIQEIKKDRNINKNLLKISYANLLGIICPEFYNLQGTIDLVNHKCSQNDFFDYLYEVITTSRNNPILIKYIEKILHYYRKKGIQINNWQDLFKEIQSIKATYSQIRDEVSFIEFCKAVDQQP
ncbi:hypothetical protein [Anabaena sp. 4-3]|uniref:hypothetical protein n=1 Tax=Anabaena sp. 4-3 TaxID=1811979 RepID=UPI00082C04DC|nr:hypothetical protein [Anabaena sp. 4-3]